MWRPRVLACLLILGCGEASEGPLIGQDAGQGLDAADHAAKFVGLWMYTSGTYTTECGGDSITRTLLGNIRFDRGATAPVILAGWDCGYRFDVDETRATAYPGQTCTAMQDLETFVTYQPVDWVFTATPDGLGMSESASFNTTVVQSGQTLVCKQSETGVLRKF